MDELLQARVLSELMKILVGIGVDYPIPKIQSTLPYLTEEDIKGVMYDLKASGVITIIPGDGTICTVIIQSGAKNYLRGLYEKVNAIPGVQVTCQEYELLPRGGGHEIAVIYCFKTIGLAFVGKPDEAINTKGHRVQVGITSSLVATWNHFPFFQAEDDRIKVLFEFGRREVEQQIKDGTLSDALELSLASYSAPAECPFDPSSIDDPQHTVFVVETSSTPLISNPGEIELATLITTCRDNINGLFYGKHKAALLQLRSERCILDLLRSVKNEDEFVSRLSSLATLVDHCNIEALRKAVGPGFEEEYNSTLLLEKLLNQIGGNNRERAVAIWRKISKLRQGYPIHSDQIKGLIEALEYFGHKYPITDYKGVWKTILHCYLESMEILLKALQAARYGDEENGEAAFKTL